MRVSVRCCRDSMWASCLICAYAIISTCVSVRACSSPTAPSPIRPKVATLSPAHPVYGSKIDILSIPVYLPLYLKWSAAREGNYRPYVIAGGGASFNVSRDREKPVVLNLVDYFCEVGFGVDLYFRWFKFCPEISYRIGFANQLYPAEGRMELAPQDVFYTTSILRMTNHCVCLTFNFE